MNRAALELALDPAHSKFVEGSEADRKRARDEWHRHRYIAQVMASDLEEIPRADITPLRFGVVEDTRTGFFYRPRRDGLVNVNFTNATAYYVRHSVARLSCSRDHPARRTAPSAKRDRPRASSGGKHTEAHDRAGATRP